MRNTLLVLLSLTFLFSSCGDKNGKPDAYGNFEAEELTVSAELGGRILTFSADEGDKVLAGTTILTIDSSDLLIKRRQLIAKRKVVASNEGGIAAEVAVLEEQQLALEREMRRSKALILKGAAPQRQYDDLESQHHVTTRKIAAIRTRNSNIFSELALVDAQIEEVDAQLRKCVVLNPIDGIILATFVKQGEMLTPGRPICKVAKLDSLYLRAYISGSQLSAIKLGQQVNVQYDGPEGISACKGIVSWVSSEAEFTPKIIQTRDDRVNLVYALKVRVPNDGSLKIGMPGELLFEPVGNKEK